MKSEADLPLRALGDHQAAGQAPKSQERPANQTLTSRPGDESISEFNIEMLLENNDSLEPGSDESLFRSSQAPQCPNDSELSTVYNRKEKSLGELCRRFLYYYGIEGKGVLYLDQCTKELGVERRRIYDIINILESFSVIRRRAKNEYHWRGIDWIVHSIEQQIAQCVSAKPELT